MVSTNSTRFPHPNSGIALAVYDLVLSFPVELKAIWNRKFGMGALLYLSIRYGTIISMLFEVLQSLLVTEGLIVSIAAHFRWLTQKTLMQNIGVRSDISSETVIFRL